MDAVEGKDTLGHPLEPGLIVDISNTIEIGCAYGEGFRQHLGAAYPQDDILQRELGDLVHVIG